MTSILKLIIKYIPVSLAEAKAQHMIASRLVNHISLKLAHDFDEVLSNRAIRNRLYEMCDGGQISYWMAHSRKDRREFGATSRYYYQVEA